MQLAIAAFQINAICHGVKPVICTDRPDSFVFCLLDGDSIAAIILACALSTEPSNRDLEAMIALG